MSTNNGRLAGKVALVTGGGQGIGKGVAQRLGAEGASVAVLDYNADTVRQTAEELRAAGVRSVAVQADVSNGEQVDQAVKTVEAELGTVDILANVAGIYGEHAPIREQTLANWERVIGINLTGTFLCSKRVLPNMLARGWGRIVNIASGHAMAGRPRVAPYAASKTAVMGFTKALALEVARNGVRVNCIMPAVTDTPMPRQYGTEEHLLRQGEANPIGRIGQPEDIAAMIAFLSTDDADYITGQTIAVNGGVRELP
jgi:3-oxoacyl-[acyl-carrier protein] reductase